MILGAGEASARQYRREALYQGHRFADYGQIHVGFG
jgi:hypothetical protein